MKAFGYCRISCTLQEAGVSLANQQQRIAAWVEANGHELAGMFIETGSGSRADNRPQLLAAMDAVCKHRGILVVYSLSRFSRSVKDTLFLTERLERANAHLSSLSESLDTSSAVGRMIFKLLSTLNEFERDVLSERTRHALAHMRRSNRRISSVVPFGYRLADDRMTLIPDSNEQSAIAQMVQWRSEGITYRGIASRLDRIVPTRHGGPWIARTVFSILKRQRKLHAAA